MDDPRSDRQVPEPAQVEAAKQAIADDDSKELAELISVLPSLGDSRDESGVSLILLALYYRRGELAELLLAARSRSLDVFELAALGHAGALREMLTTSPEVLVATSADGFSALGLASFFGRTGVVELLVETGIDVDRPADNPMQVRALNSAAANPDRRAGLKISRLLLQAGARADVQQQGGYTPLHQAAAHGNLELMQLLFEFGASSSVKTEAGELAIDLARKGDHSAAVELLETHG